MVELFISLLNVSIAAGWAILAVIILRLLLKAIKAPSYIINVLWLIIGVRLVLPFSIISPLSLVPSAHTVSVDIMQAEAPSIITGIDSVNVVIDPFVKDVAYSAQQSDMNLWQMLALAMTVVWAVVLVALLLHGLVRWLILKRKLKKAVCLSDNVYLYDGAPNAFVFGLPAKIYLSAAIPETQRELVVLHEQTHIKRKDHWWKPIAYLLVCLNWYNPLVWLAYALFSRDVEAACDQKAVKNMTMEQKLDYSQALLDCSLMPRSVALCPVAFGEVSIKTRIKGVLKYKKPALWSVITAVLSCVVLAVCFLTEPMAKAVSTPDFIPLEELKYVETDGESKDWRYDYSFEKYPRFTVPALKDIEFIKTENSLVILKGQEELEYVSLNGLVNGIYLRDYTRDGVVDVCYMRIFNTDETRAFFNVYDCVNNRRYQANVRDFRMNNAVSAMLVDDNSIRLYQHNYEKGRILDMYVSDEELEKELGRSDYGVISYKEKEFEFDTYKFRASPPADQQYIGTKFGTLLLSQKAYRFILIVNERERASGSVSMDGDQYYMTDDKTGNVYAFDKGVFSFNFNAQASASTAGWTTVIYDHDGSLPDQAKFVLEEFYK